ncbi:hypothetical protein BaRGS_00011673 [Batillaria attramentaria]|uniref:Secreted protein n=1 Tax=Batillaria attramentaria TaxID=370345 RepID=A0ABD0LCU5_9CAEN
MCLWLVSEVFAVFSDVGSGAPSTVPRGIRVYDIHVIPPAKISRIQIERIYLFRYRKECLSEQPVAFSQRASLQVPNTCHVVHNIGQCRFEVRH